MSDQAPTPAVNPLEQALLTILQKTVNAVEAGVDFLSGQLPDVIHQLLMWHAIKSGIFFLLFGSMMVVSIIFAKNNYIKAMAIESAGDDGFGRFVMTAIFMVISFILFVATINRLDWLQIMIAPKLHLIEYAAELIKK